MRNLLALAVAAFLTVGVLSADVDAGQKRHCNCARCQQVRRAQPSLFHKLMDLERRKNIWLKKTFLGR